MAKNWYILHTYSGQEGKVKQYIEKNIRDKEFEKYIGDVKVPEEEIQEMKEGKKRKIVRKFFPGYLLIELEIPQDQNEWLKIYSAITGITGVTGFLQIDKNRRPRPLPPEDLKNILQKMGEIKTTDGTAPKIDYEIGTSVKVVDGPFTNFTGTVEEINHEKGKLKVVVEIFGRSTPVELDYLQVEKA